MTSRATPGTWYQTAITAAQWTGFDAPDPGSAGAPMFVADFTDPRFTADLWMVDRATGAVRQLTNFHRVIPEFEWNFGYTKLLWSGNARPDSHTTWVARFAGISASQRRVPRTPAPGLFGQPVDMARVRSPAEPAHDLRPPAPPLSAPLRIPTARVTRGDRQTLPSVVISYAELLNRELHDLATVAAGRIEQPPL
jgi:hypothetical protein